MSALEKWLPDTKVRGKEQLTKYNYQEVRPKVYKDVAQSDP